MSPGLLDPPGDREPVSVAIDGGPLLGAMTGVGVAVEHMIEALNARSDVSLHPYALSFRGQLRDGIRRLPLPAAVAQRFWSHAAHPRLDRWLRPAEVLHGTNYVVGPSRLPRIVSVYDCWFLRNEAAATPAVRRAGAVLRRAVASGATVHASSHSTGDAVRELLGTERVEVVALAPLPAPALPDADLADGSAPIAELAGVPFVLALGTIERRKNLPMLVRAFGALADQLPDLRLVLAGADGDDRAAVDAAIDALHRPARARVILTSRIDARVKHWLLSNATVLAYPSLDEGFGFPLLEAMQHDLPVVASTAGSIPEVAGHAAVLVDPADVDGLAAALLGVIGEDARRSELVVAGRARLLDMTWTETAARLTAVYRRLAAEGPR